jgi:hypothetical protein
VGKMPKSIDEITSGQFVQALEALGSRLTPKRRKMLARHYRSAGRAITPRMMSSTFGWANRGSAHLHYGGFAGVVADELGVEMSPDGDNSIRWQRSSEPLRVGLARRRG